MSSGAVAEERHGWLHGRHVDVVILLGPWLFAIGMLALGGATWNDPRVAVWVTQFVLGNTTHVILTFVLLAYRRDILGATPSQARIVVVGSLGTFFATWALFRAVQQAAPTWFDFPMAIAAIFGTHHRLAQGKGVWSLYNLRASTRGFDAPSARERSLHGAWVSVGLVPIMISWLFVPSSPTRSFPLLQAIPNEPAWLPYETSYVLAAGWVIYVASVIVELRRASRRNVPKMLHVASHGAAITLAILAPVWGTVVWGCIHGLEYGFLCDRMMQPRAGDTFAPPGSRIAAIWVTRGLIFLSLLPLLYVGLKVAPFAQPLVAKSVIDGQLVLALNSLVLAHYFADALIYRFRIPEVRKVALTRMGFS